MIRDITANLYCFGFREWAYGRPAVRTLALYAGDTVVEVGCDTGLTFGLLDQAVRSEGRIIGIDLTDMMLAQGRRRIQKHGWSNLVQADALTFAFPAEVEGILSTFVLWLVPECASV